MLSLKKSKKGHRPILIIQALIRKNTGQYLVIKRAGSVEPGTWEFPGGMVDSGEMIEKALMREVKEETGLKVDIERFVGWGQGYGIKNEETGELYDRFVMFFEVRLIKGKLKTDDSEISDHKWASLEEFMQFKPLSKPLKDFVKKFQVIPQEMLDQHGITAGDEKR